VSVAVDHNIIIQRYSAFDKPEQPYFLFNIDSGHLEKQHNAFGVRKGWLVDFEQAMRGAKCVIFFAYNGGKFVALDKCIYQIGEGFSAVSHKCKGFFSELQLVDSHGEAHLVTYLTPWWRLIFDDGMFPDSHFPLEYFSGKWSDPEYYPP
jgi:hypothetical protein